MDSVRQEDAEREEPDCARPGHLSIWRDFIIGPADIPPWAILALWSSNSGRRSQPAVSTKPGKVHHGWN